MKLTLKMSPVILRMLPCLGGILIGFSMGWWLWRPLQRPLETYAPAIVQKDQSVVLERKPDAKAKPVQVVPKGAKVERVVQVVVQPHQGESAQTLSSQGQEPPVKPSNVPAALPCPPCPPVTVDLTLVRLEDQTMRVIASSPDGQVRGGVDIPIIHIKSHSILKNALGIRYEIGSKGEQIYGPVYHRDFAFVRVSLDVSRSNITKEIRTGASILITF